MKCYESEQAISLALHMLPLKINIVFNYTLVIQAESACDLHVKAHHKVLSAT